MALEKINHPYLTAIRRSDLSVPVRYLLSHDLLKGRILDFGCGFGYDTDELKRRGYDIIGYDYYYRTEYPDGKFDTIFCVYVLCKLAVDCIVDQELNYHIHSNLGVQYLEWFVVIFEEILDS